MKCNDKNKITWNRVILDMQYIVLNRVVNHIPCWWIRKKIYTKMGMTIGMGSRIGIGTIILNPSRIEIGNRSVINENCMLDGRGGLIIGHDTSISAYAKILTASHKSNGRNFDYYSQKTKIGSYVWLGTSSIILDGSVIKNYTIIGAGAVLKGVTEERDILVGNPAVCIKKRELNQTYQLKYQAYFR